MSQKVIAQREITNNYRETIKDLDGIKKGLQDLIDGLDDHDADMQKSYDDMGDEIEKQKDKYKDLGKKYDDQVNARQKAADDAQSFLDELDKPKESNEVLGNNEEPQQWEEVDNDMKEWEEETKIEIPKMPDMPAPPTLREPPDIKPFESVPITPRAFSMPPASDNDDDGGDDEKKDDNKPKDENELVLDDEEEVAPDEKEEDLIKEEQQLEDQLKNESIDKLLDMQIDDPKAKKILGDPKKYDLPKGDPGASGMIFIYISLIYKL